MSAVEAGKPIACQFGIWIENNPKTCPFRLQKLDSVVTPSAGPGSTPAGRQAVEQSANDEGLRQQTVERKRLHDLLREGRTLPLTLVVAPAGWGKSTIVADWLSDDGVTAGWVSLDGGDNDPQRFWRYLLLAADQAGSAAGAAALRRLDAAGSDVLRDVLPAFVNELAAAADPLVLVLDDYHLVTSARVHTTVATLLDRSRRSCT